MAIQVTCSCGKQYSVSEDFAGKKAICKRCGKEFRIPSAHEATGSDSLFDALDDETATSGNLLPVSHPRSNAGRTNASTAIIVSTVAGTALAMLAIGIGLHALMNPTPPSTAPVAIGPRNPTGVQADPEQETDATSVQRNVPPKPPAVPPSTQGTPTVCVATNLWGATIEVLNSESGETVDSRTLEGDQVEQSFTLAANGNYKYRVSIGKIVRERADVASNGRVELMFDQGDVAEFCRLSACLIRLPEGGHGSGFLLQDRQTIITAAHVLTTKRVEDVEFVFDPTNDEEIHKGAQLMDFDAENDFAIVHLAAPVAPKWPYLWPASETPSSEQIVLDRQAGTITQKNTAVVTIGNPGEGESYRPLYMRQTSIVDRGANILRLGTELKPGESGGPVCLSSNGMAVGLISFKIDDPRNYRVDGMTFARSITMVNDSLRNWRQRSPESQLKEMERVSEQFAQRYGCRCAYLAGLHMLLDSLIYLDCCVDVANDCLHFIVPFDAQQQQEFQMHQLRGLKSSQLRAIRERMNKERATKVDEYLKTRCAKLTERIREKVTPHIQEECEKWYHDAIGDDTVDETLKQHLKDAHEGYTYLKQLAENFDTNERTKSTTPQQFVEDLIQQGNDAIRSASTAMKEAAQGL